MAMVSVKLLAAEMGLEDKDVRRIARNNGFGRYKDNQIEMYNADDFDAFTNEQMKARTLSPEHKAKLNAKKKS